MATRFDWNLSGFREIRTSMARGAVNEAASEVLGRAGAGFAMDGYETGGKGRWRALVYPESGKAQHLVRKDPSILLRAL